MTKVLRILKQNLGLKLISVCLAFVLWLVVVNVSNPEVTDNVTMDIQVNYGDELMKAGKAFTLDSRTVRVTYKVRSSYRSLVKPSSFKAYVDMRDYSVTGAVPVYVEAGDEVSGIISGISQYPMVIHVTTEDMQEKAFKPSANIVGQAAEGYVAGPAVLSPDEVILYGPVSEIGRISGVGISVDLGGADSDIVGMGRTLFYNANGNVISVDERVSVRNDITYKIPIYKTKSLSINVPTSGQPQTGYTLSGLETDPGFVSVYGVDSVLGKYNTLYLPSGLMDITGADSNVTITVDAGEYLPNGLYLVQPTTVTAVAKITRQTVQVPPQQGQPPVIVQPEQTPETSAAQEDTMLELENETVSPDETEGQEHHVSVEHFEDEQLPEDDADDMDETDDTDETDDFADDGGDSPDETASSPDSHISETPAHAETDGETAGDTHGTGEETPEQDIETPETHAGETSDPDIHQIPEPGTESTEPAMDNPGPGETEAVVSAEEPPAPQAAETEIQEPPVPGTE